MSLQGVIFDLDGVICSTDRYHYLAWKELADSLGLPFGEEKNHRMRGVSRMESLAVLLGEQAANYSAQQREELAHRKNRTYRGLLAGMTPADLAPEVQCTLDALRARGLRLAIGSSSENAKYILEKIGLAGYFDAVSDGTNITRSKPHPEVFLKAAEYLSLPPHACLVVEDALSGVEAAHAAGMLCAALGDAAGGALPDYRLGTFMELLEVPVLQQQ